MLRSDPSSWAVTPTRSAPTRPTASFSSPRSAESVVGTSRSNARADLMSASEKGPTSPERLGWAAERNLPAAKLLHPLPILPTCSSAWLARTTLVMFVHWPTATCRLPGQGGGAITSAAWLLFTQLRTVAAPSWYSSLVLRANIGPSTRSPGRRWP
jgi:hypothetical protein